MLLEAIEKQIREVLEKDYSEFKDVAFNVSFIEQKTGEKNINNFGDVACNVAMILAKDLQKKPTELANEIVEKINLDSDIFSKIEVAGPGFINFTFSNNFLKDNLNKSVQDNLAEIKNKNILNLKDEVALVEYTDPNPFKVFHIGHLMTNIIGESIANIYEIAGADVKRINYQGDVGRHIAINIYAILKDKNINEFYKFEQDIEHKNFSIREKVKWLGEKYAEGYADFDSGEANIENIVSDINKNIYTKSDDLINRIYVAGRKWSLDYFEELYNLLGTKFDKYIFESEAAPFGLALVVKNIENHVFEIGDEGAVIYDGEKDGLHKRVFINKNGLPTYEAKDLGNMQIKLSYFPETKKSVVVTAVEQSDYFKVLYKVIEKLSPELKGNLIHFGHGMMRFADGKMSSRKGNIIAGEDLIENVKENLIEKFENSRIENEQEKKDVLEKVAIGAIKVAVLKQAIGRDVIFDMEKVVNVEGDSGPYLQYTFARFSSVAKDSVCEIEINENNREMILSLEKIEDILEVVVREIAPQKIFAYAIEIARNANSWYAKNKVEGNKENEFLAFKIKEILGILLKILAIHATEKM